MSMPFAAVLDTNSYLSFPTGDFDELLREEAKAGAIPYADPWVALELLAHLADPKDRQHRPARAAIKRLSQHAGSVRGRPLRDAILVDSEEQVALLLFRAKLPDHRRSLSALVTACEYVAAVPNDAALDDIAPILEVIAQHVASAEAGHAQRVFDVLVRGLVPDALSWDALARNAELRTKVTQFLRSPDAVIGLATAEITRAYANVNRSVPSPIPAEQIAAVLGAFRFALELQNHSLLGVAERGWNLAAPGRRNWIWDVLIAFNVGQSVNQRPLRLITNDDQFHQVAARTGHVDLVLRRDVYRRNLTLA